jgi:hypothetical protein
MCTIPIYTLSTRTTESQRTNIVQGSGYWQKQQTPTKSHAEDTKVERFTDKFGVTEEEFSEINDDFIDELVEQHADDAKLLIKELLFFHETQKETIERLTRKLEQ